MDALFGMMGFVGLIVTALFLTAKKGDKKTLQKLLLLFLASFVIGLALPGSKPKEEPTKEVKAEGKEIEKEETEKIVKETPKKEVAKERKKKDIIDSTGKEVFGGDYVGSTLNWDYENATFKQDGSIDEDNSVIDFLNVETSLTDNLTENMMVKNFLLKTVKFLDKSKSTNYNKVFIGAKADFKDTYGNVDKQYAVKITIDKSEVDKINFSEFDYKNLPAIAEEFEVHPGIAFDLK